MKQAIKLILLGFILILALGFMPVMKIDNIYVFPFYTDTGQTYIDIIERITTAFLPLFIISAFGVLVAISSLSKPEEWKEDILFILSIMTLIAYFVFWGNLDVPHYTVEDVGSITVVWNPKVVLYPTFYILHFFVPLVPIFVGLPLFYTKDSF